MQDQKTNSVTNVPKSRDRRNVMKKIAAGVGVLTSYSVLPAEWTRPIVGQIILPAHAETSGTAPAEEESTNEAAAAPAASEEYNTTEVYTLRSFEGNNKRFTWLNQTGASYGGQIKFVFSNDCGELIVPDAAKSFGADGTTSNHNQAFYFCGTDFPAGSRENNGNRASVFAPPGCPAATVTLHYNK